MGCDPLADCPPGLDSGDYYAFASLVRSARIEGERQKRKSLPETPPSLKDSLSYLDWDYTGNLQAVLCQLGNAALNGDRFAVSEMLLLARQATWWLGRIASAECQPSNPCPDWLAYASSFPLLLDVTLKPLPDGVLPHLQAVSKSGFKLELLAKVGERARVALVQFRNARAAQDAGRKWACAAVRCLDETRRRCNTFDDLRRAYGLPERGTVLTAEAWTQVENANAKPEVRWCRYEWSIEETPDWAKRAAQLPAFSRESCADWGRAVRKLILAEVPDFEVHPAWNDFAPYTKEGSRCDRRSVILNSIANTKRLLAIAQEGTTTSPPPSRPLNQEPAAQGATP